MQTYFERDLVELGLNLPPQRILRLWSLLAQYHGNLINYANMAQILEVSVSTLKNYLALLEGTFMIRTLLPWHDNGKKRLVKTPKIYIRDVGIYHQLLAIKNYESLIVDIDRGASWDSFALEEVIKALIFGPRSVTFGLPISLRSWIYLFFMRVRGWVLSSSAQINRYLRSRWRVLMSL